jgi:hypothetical protein
MPANFEREFIKVGVKHTGLPASGQFNHSPAPWAARLAD